MRIGSRVNTTLGMGTLRAYEGPYGSSSKQWYTYGVELDVIPERFKGAFLNDIMFFLPKEIIKEEKSCKD